MNRNPSFVIRVYFILCILPFCICGLPFYAFCRFDTFGGCHVIGAPGDDVIIAYGVGTPYMYIYSLGHFLTTKGALIDGDGYPPKNPKNDPKNHSKLIKIHSKLVTKNGQKQ